MWALLRNKIIPLAIRNVRFSGSASPEQIVKTQKLMKSITLFIVPVVVGLTAWNGYRIEMEHQSHDRPEYVAYPYLEIQTRPYPWGDGKHTLFHNPKTNYIPGIGYEEDW